MSATLFYTFERQRAVTAGNTYTANSNTASVNGFTALSGNCLRHVHDAPAAQQQQQAGPVPRLVGQHARSRPHRRVHAGEEERQAGRLERRDLRPGAVDERRERGKLGEQPPRPARRAAPGTIAAYFIAAAPLPVVTTNILELRLNGTYAVAAHQSLRVVYAYMRMRSVDWAYDGMQIGDGSPSGVLPTNETPFNYGVHVVGRVIPHRVLTGRQEGVVCERLS